MRTAMLAIAILAAACTSTTSSAVGAATMTAAAVGAAAVSRSQGGCIAICTNGMVCNPRNGLCEHPPCDNSCGPGERCEVTYKGSQCVSATATGVATQAPGTGGAAGVAPVTQAPDANHASPTIVPAAEKR
jgi:hypothetical protein